MRLFQDDSPCGILNVAKPKGCTSRDIVNRVQRAFRAAGAKNKGPGKLRFGHAGTLDPMAEGVLLICVGKATQFINRIHEYTKTYTGEFILGQTSDTDDATGTIDSTTIRMPDYQTVADTLQKQVGTFLQTPPMFSAVKLDGKRAYQRARAGEAVEITPRSVTVHQLQLLKYAPPKVQVFVECGSGTYIRSIGRDLGEALGTGALMSRLVRNSIGPFQLNDAISDSSEFAQWRKSLQDVKALFDDLPFHELTDNELKLLKDGKRVPSPFPDGRSPDRWVGTCKDQFASLLELESNISRTNQKVPKYKADINWVPGWFQSK